MCSQTIVHFPLRIHSCEGFAFAWMSWQCMSQVTDFKLTSENSFKIMFPLKYLLSRLSRKSMSLCQSFNFSEMLRICCFFYLFTPHCYKGFGTPSHWADTWELSTIELVSTRWAGVRQVLALGTVYAKTKRLERQSLLDQCIWGIVTFAWNGQAMEPEN